MTAGKIELVLAVVAGLFIIACLLFAIRRRRPRHLKNEYFVAKWQELQKTCRNRDEWAAAVISADHLLDEALRKRRLGGRTMGERLVRAQRLFTDNDGVWFGHKLRNKIEDDPSMKLKEDEVKGALVGIRQALKDLGALPK